MHTFLINTTSIEEFDKFNMILYKDIHDFKLTILNEKLSDLSRCVKSIEEDVNKELAIRENFNIILITELRARSMEAIANINRYKERLIFYIQNELINPLLLMGFRPSEVGLIFLENYKSFLGNEGIFRIDNSSLIRSSIGLWPWERFILKDKEDRDEETQEFLRQAYNYLKGQKVMDFSISSSAQMMKSFMTALEDRFTEEMNRDKTLAEKILKNPEELVKFVEDEYYSYEDNNHFHGFELSNYKFGNLDIFNKSPEDKDIAVFSSLLAVQDSIQKERIFEDYGVDLLSRSDTNTAHQLNRYYHLLEKIRDTINPVNNEPIYGFNTELKKTHHLTIREFEKKFKETKLDDVKCFNQKRWLPKLLFSKSDREECSGFLIQAKKDVDEDLKLLEEGVRLILRDFHENTKPQIDSTITNNYRNLLDDSNKIKLDERSMKDYEDELKKERADLRVKMEKQNIEAIQNNSFQNDFDNLSAKANFYIRCLSGVRALTYLFIICLGILAITLPSILTNYLDNTLNRTILFLYITVPVITVFLLLYLSVNNYREKLFNLLGLIEKIVLKYELEIKDLYLNLYERYDTYIPGLTYLNAYTKNFNQQREEQRHISQKKIFHREKLKEHMDNSEKLFHVFLTEEKLNNPIDDPLKSKDLDPNLDIIGNYDIYNFYNKNE